MKRFTLLFAVMFVLSNVFAQTETIIWSEYFQDTLVWGATPFPPSGWTIIDEDGDGKNWEYRFYDQTGEGYLVSHSYLEGSGALTPNNWIVTPQIDLTGVGQNDQVKFRWGACPTANTPQYRLEHYGVFISTTDVQPSSFSKIFEETFTQETPNWVFAPKEVDITQYKGQQIYIAFRHWNVTDMDRVAIDTFRVVKISSPQNLNNIQNFYSLYPNPACDYVKIFAQNFEKAEIYNSVGQIIMTSKENTIKTATLPEGFYIVKIYADNREENHKLLIRR